MSNKFTLAELMHADKLGADVGNARSHVKHVLSRIDNLAILAGGAPIDSTDPRYAPLFTAYESALKGLDHAVKTEAAWWRSKGFNL